MRGFEKCHKELRFRTIDCRIKEQKIRQLEEVRRANDGILQRQASDMGCKTTNDSLLEVLERIDASKLDADNNKQCSVM